MKTRKLRSKIIRVYTIKLTGEDVTRVFAALTLSGHPSDRKLAEKILEQAVKKPNLL